MASYLQLLVSYLINNQTALNNHRDHEMPPLEIAGQLSPTDCYNETLTAVSQLNRHNNHEQDHPHSHHNNQHQQPQNHHQQSQRVANKSMTIQNMADHIIMQYKTSDLDNMNNAQTQSNYQNNLDMAAATSSANPSKIIQFTNNILNSTNYIDDGTHPAPKAYDSNSLMAQYGGDDLNQQQLTNIANECYNKQQIREYYSDYDILIGIRIATSLAILFVAFIIFVVYKTICHERRHYKRVQQNNLRLTNHLYNIP